MTEEEKKKGFQSKYTRMAIEWLTVALFGGVILCILGVMSALVYWAWTA